MDTLSMWLGGGRPDPCDDKGSRIETIEFGLPIQMGTRSSKEEDTPQGYEPISDAERCDLSLPLEAAIVKIPVAQWTNQEPIIKAADLLGQYPLTRTDGRVLIGITSTSVRTVGKAEKTCLIANPLDGDLLRTWLTHLWGSVNNLAIVFWDRQLHHVHAVEKSVTRELTSLGYKVSRVRDFPMGSASRGLALYLAW